MANFELGLTLLLRQSLYRPSATFQLTASRKAPRGHMDNGVRLVCWHTDGIWIVVDSIDDTIPLWNPDTGECITSFRAKRPYEGMNITAVTGLTATQTRQT